MVSKKTQFTNNFTIREIMNKYAFVAIGIFMMGRLGVYGQATSTTSGQVRAITTAVPFLLICPDSRSGALGEAGVTIADNANAIYWNPSILAFSSKKYGFATNYTPWLRNIVPDINHAYVPAYFNFGDKGGVAGIALTFFSLGNIEFTDNSGIKTGDYNPSEFALTTAYSHKVTDNLSAGVALRYINSSLVTATTAGGFPTKPANSVAGDANLFYTKDFSLRGGQGEIPMNFRFGINLSNMGAKVNYTNSSKKDFLPANMKIGWSLKANMDSYNSITLVNDYNKLMVPSEGGQSNKPLLSGMFSSFNDAQGGFSEEISEFNTSIGLEYWYNNVFSARAGYFYEDPMKGNRKFITLGGGLRFKTFGLDFAYLVPFQQNHPLQNTIRFSLSFDFENN